VGKFITEMDGQFKQWDDVEDQKQLKMCVISPQLEQIQQQLEKKQQKQEREETELNAFIIHGVAVVQWEGLVLQEIEREINLRLNVNSSLNPGFNVENMHVIEFNLQGIGLSSLPESIFTLKSLWDLNLNGNKLTLLPDRIGE
jgi:hypothetical protein